MCYIVRLIADPLNSTEDRLLMLLYTGEVTRIRNQYFAASVIDCWPVFTILVINLDKDLFRAAAYQLLGTSKIWVLRV